MNLHTYLPQDRRRALAHGLTLPDRTQGTALFADISGFTPLTETLRASLGPRRGAEELTTQVNTVYTALITEIERYGGSVIGFAGDGLICWFDDADGPAALRAVSCGLALQEVIRPFQTLPSPDKSPATLAIKVAMATGPVRRFAVGDPNHLYLDTLAGTTIARLAAAERLAQKREVVIDEATAQALTALLRLQTWRQDPHTAERFGVVQQISAAGIPLLEAAPVALPVELIRPWLHPPVYERELAGQAAFLAEFRPCAALFALFSGIDYEDDAAEMQLDTITCQMQTIAARYEGDLLQLIIGDKGSYAYLNFGALNVHEDDPRRALKAAIALQSMNQELDWLAPPQIGISYGLMWAGTYGGQTRRTYTALGDDVNVAARLMETADPGQILVTPPIRTAVAHQYHFEPLPPRQVKGKSDPLHPFRLTGRHQRQTVRLQEPAYTLPIVGREAEVALVEEKLTLARQGQAQIIGIIAEAGLGKSRLVAEVIATARQRAFMVFGGACQSDGLNTPYLVWRAIGSAFFDVEPDAPLADQIDALSQAVNRLAPQRLAALPLLGTLLNLPIPDSDWTQALEPEIRRTALHALLEDCFKAAAQNEPILMVFEDMHWVDALSHDLLLELAQSLVRHPVSFVLAYRPPQLERLQQSPLKSLPNFTPVMLGQLRDSDVKQMIQAKLSQLYPRRSGDIPSELVEKLMARTQGSPFYLEELLNYLRDHDIDPRNPAVLEKIDLPDSLYTLILSRIDQLTELQKTTLRVASIIGRQFQAPWLPGYYPELGNLAEVKVALAQLDSLDITLLDSPEPEMAYLFKHIVTHEVTYQTLPFATRARLHEQFANYLETTFHDALPVETLAFHYGHSTNIAKQRYYLQKAGEAAQNNFANDAALAYYMRLLPLLTDPSAKARIHLKRGDIWRLVGDWTEAEVDYRAILNVSEHPLDRAQAQYALGKICRLRSNYDQAISWLREAEAGFLALDNPLGIVQTLTEVGYVFDRQGEFRQATEALQRALKVAHEVSYKKGIAQALNLLGNRASDQGDYSTAQTLYAESLSINRLLNDKLGISIALNNLGLITWAQGDYASARTLFEEGLSLKREMGNKQGIASLVSNLGLVTNDQGNYGGALALLTEALDLRRDIGDKFGVASSLNNLGNVAFNQGNYETAHSLLTESLSLTAALDDALGSAYNLGGLAEIAMKRGQFSRAATLSAAVGQLLIDINSKLEPAYMARIDEIVTTVQTELDEPSYQAAWSAGEQMALAEAIAYALDDS